MHRSPITGKRLPMSQMMVEQPNSLKKQTPILETLLNVLIGNL